MSQTLAPLAITGSTGYVGGRVGVERVCLLTRQPHPDFMAARVGDDGVIRGPGAAADEPRAVSRRAPRSPRRVAASGAIVEPEGFVERCIMSKPDDKSVDDFDLSTERLVAPEINNPWWPQAIPTDGPAPAP